MSCRQRKYNIKQTYEYLFPEFTFQLNRSTKTKNKQTTTNKKHQEGRMLYSSTSLNWETEMPPN